MMIISYWLLLSYLRNSPSSLSPVPIFGSGVLMTDFAARRLLFVFNDLFPIFIPKRNAFGIIMLMRQILLNIMHIGSMMTGVISDAVRKPAHVLTIISFYNTPSGHTKARIFVFLFWLTFFYFFHW